MELKVSLEQWRALLAVVDAGGYAQAAEMLEKSQSAVSYAIQKMEAELDVRLFRLQGRKAVLTDVGEILYRRAQSLVIEASRLESSAQSLASGVEAQLYIAVDAIFPLPLLLRSLDVFAAEFPETRVELLETVLSGTDEALRQREVDLAITPQVPQGLVGDVLMHARFIAVAQPDHPLHQLGRPLLLQDLRRHRQLVIRDSGSGGVDAGWLGAEQRWTVSHMSTSVHAAVMGLGFAWYPEEIIADELAKGSLQRLPLQEGEERFADLYLVYAEADYTGPAARRFGEILRSTCANLKNQQEQNAAHY